MDQSLPHHLAERFRWVVSPEATSKDPGEFVLYWMHNALRAHENPALDVAICLARQNGLPLLVYHGLSEDYPFASDRLHAFILQGQREAQCELEQRGISAACHVQRNGNRGPYLRLLVDRAAVLISEEMPVQPLVGWIERLAARTKTPIAIVDTSCVVPTQMLEGDFANAAEFRSAVGPLYDQRVGLPYVEQDATGLEFHECLPFTSTDLQDTCLSKLIGQCRVDHSIAPVAESPGGSRAGYARWTRFKERGLRNYAQNRHDPTNRNGVSRVSAYLHFGVVSPFRIAREAFQLKAEKFLDELLVWRELAFHYCFRLGDAVDCFESLPEWAQATLGDHQEDPRFAHLSWERLARGKSGMQHWDTCQESLIRHGELHNSVRMTWGKGFLSLTRTPQQAFRHTLDLNHRYSLDGRDPCSYGGVLWCYGQFDQPFPTPNPVFGTLRPKALETRTRISHETAADSIVDSASEPLPVAVDESKFRTIVHRPVAPSMPRVAIVGAGLAGLSAARTLADHGLQVTVFDKSRGVGGRMAARRVDAGFDFDHVTFDHGAQYFTARDIRFSRFVCSWMEDGIVQPWLGKIVELERGGQIVKEKQGQPRFVGVPTMNSIAKHIASDLTVQTGCRIAALKRHNDETWELMNDQSEAVGIFDLVICNAPPVQVADLVRDQADWVSTLAEVEMNPCIAMMLHCDGLESLPWQGAFVNDGPISWIARNDSKPGRQVPPRGQESRGSTWVVHASTQWSREHIDDCDEELEKQLMAALEGRIGTEIEAVHHCRVHRWRYSIPAVGSDVEFLWDSSVQLGACGDWLCGGRIEGAFLSGQAMAGTIMREITIDRPHQQ